MIAPGRHARAGRFGEPGWESRDPEAANAAMAELAGKGAKQARKRDRRSCSREGGLARR